MHDWRPVVTCPKCNDAGGHPVEWVDANGHTHRQIAYCDCDAGRTRADRDERTLTSRYRGSRPETYGT